MFASRSSAVYEFLKEQRLLGLPQLDALNEEHQATGRPLADLVLDLGSIGRADLLRSLASYLNWPYLAALPAGIPGEAIAAVPGRLAHDYGVLPLGDDGGMLELVIGDPFRPHAAEDLAFALDRQVRLLVADPDQVGILIQQHYGEDDSDAGIEELLQQLPTGDYAMDSSREWSERDLESMAEQAPIIRFVQHVLGKAVREQASDIHFEPFARELKIRYRVDGALFEMPPPPSRLALPITSRIKVLASLDIAERRLPQDGRIRLQVRGRTIDLRVSTLPTQFGESVVLRVLDQSALRLELSQLGLPADVLGGIQEIVRRPNGIFIATGPTGSGKTTTLYSCLRLINTIERKLLTAEDPVEYELEGIMQVAVNPAAGLTFTTALRSFLRQDPDVILVGEIRDLDTARIAIQAALTGHLVMTTLHTNDAAGAITRLVDLGVEPFLIASTLEAVLAQRLVRRVCPACGVEYQPPGDLLQQLGLAGNAAGERRFRRGPGCVACNQSGYRGRVGIYEWLPVTDSIRELITARTPTVAIRQRAIALGMRTLREDGIRAIYDGRTSIEEVIRYT